MEASALLQSSASTIYQPVFKSGFSTNRTNFASKFNLSNGFTKNHCVSLSASKKGQRRGFEGRRSFVVKASSSSSSPDSSDSPIAPLQLESPVGQFLSQILKSHPHLVPAAVDQQLEKLQTDREAEKVSPEKDEPSTTGTDLVLYRRIAEVKANERRRALEEILYTLVVQKFMDANVSLVPSIAPVDRTGRVDAWPAEEGKLEQLHSQEAYEMIKNHLALILGNRLGDSNAVAEISKLRVGQVYAASVMYGYFLKRVDQRFQLEKAMKVLSSGSNAEENDIVQPISEDIRSPKGSENAHDVEQPAPHPEVSSWSDSDSTTPRGFGSGIKSSRLRNYVMSFDAETLQKYATIRSKEAVSIIEKHTEALFGRPEIAITPQGTIDQSKDDLIKISFGGLKTLVLEAVTFGSFLWDVESHVDSRCLSSGLSLDRYLTWQIPSPIWPTRKTTWSEARVKYTSYYP